MRDEDFGKMMKVEGIAYTGYAGDDDLPAWHISNGLQSLHKRGVIRMEGCGDDTDYYYLHVRTGAYWKYSISDVGERGLREVLEVRHSGSPADAVFVGHECLGDVAGLLVGVKGI